MPLGGVRIECRYETLVTEKHAYGETLTYFEGFCVHSCDRIGQYECHNGEHAVWLYYWRHRT